jgi:L-amino acid N-acyltransferase YncA
MSVTTRAATADDTAALARIYNEGIEDRVATFQTETKGADDMLAWFDDRYPLVVGEEDGEVVAWASASAYRPGRAWYDGIAEFSIYVTRAARGRGAGRATLQALIDASEAAGCWKLVSRIFPENQASLALCRSLGFREVGVYRRHGKLDGEWRDCVVVELLLGEAATTDDL